MQDPEAREPGVGPWTDTVEPTTEAAERRGRRRTSKGADIERDDQAERIEEADEPQGGSHEKAA